MPAKSFAQTSKRKRAPIDRNTTEKARACGKSVASTKKTDGPRRCDPGVEATAVLRKAERHAPAEDEGGEIRGDAETTSR